MKFLIENQEWLPALLYGLSAFIGIPLYLVTICRICKLSGWLPKSTFWFHLSFILTNFCIIMFTPYWAASGFYKGFPFVDGVAEFISYICLLCGINSMVLLFCLCLERFGDVSNTKWYKAFTTSRVIAIILAALLFASVWSLPPLIGYAKFDKHSSTRGCLYNWLNFDHEHVTYIMLNAAVFFGAVLPAALYLVVRCFLLQRKTNDGPKSRNAILLRLLLRIMAIFFVAWTPFLLSSIYGVLRTSSNKYWSNLEFERLIKEFTYLPAAWLKLILAVLPFMYTFTIYGPQKVVKSSKKANPYKTKNINKKMQKEKTN